MTDELLPCPFCGGEASKRLFYKGKYRVHCNVCDANSDDVWDTEAEAIAAWNRRSVTASAVYGFKAAERTCEYVGDDVSGGCSECRGWLDPACAYCPSCGARVVGGEGA